MKYIILFFLAISLSLVSSCKKDDPVVETPISTQGIATFDIGSTQKEFTKANSFNSGILALGNSTDEVISLFFPIPTTFPTTYDMSTDDMVTASYTLNGKSYNATNGISGIGAKGSLLITISKYSSSKISGTFEFTGVDDKNAQMVITNGVFTDVPDL